MKRKTIIILSVILVGLFLGSAALAGVLSERPAKETEIRHKVEEIEVPFAYGPEDLAILEKGRLPAREELKVCLYPEEEILADLRPNIVLRRLLSESYWMMPVILGHYPTDNIRYVENERGGHYYAVWMTDGGARLYVFFDGNTSYPYGYPVYMLKALSFADFGELRVGDPADRVGKIDPAYRAYSAGFPSMEEQGKTAKEANESVQKLFSNVGIYVLTSVHLLKDGFLEIRYAYAEDGSLVIDDLDFHADFCGRNNIVDALGAENADEYDREMDHSYKILTEDYIGDEIVVADTEAKRTRRIPADEVEWRLAAQDGEGREIAVFSRKDFSDEELTAVMASRYAGGNAGHVIETVFATGITPEKLAEKAGFKSFEEMEVLLNDGESIVLSEKTMTGKIPLFAWIENKEYAMSRSETGVSLAVQEGEINEYYPSVKAVRIKGGT